MNVCLCAVCMRVCVYAIVDTNMFIYLSKSMQLFLFLLISKET